MSNDDTPTVTFGTSAAETVIEQFGWHVGEDGVIRAEDGAPAPTTDEKPVSADEIGGIVPDETGNPMLVRDGFTAIGEYVERAQSEGKQ